MDKLMKMLESGEMPNVIELMAALSDISDYWPGDDSDGLRSAGAHKARPGEYLYPPQRCMGCG